MPANWEGWHFDYFLYLLHPLFLFYVLLYLLHASNIGITLYTWEECLRVGTLSFMYIMQDMPTQHNAQHIISIE